MNGDNGITAADALLRLKNGNAAYIDADRGTGDISRAVREKTRAEGQKPYAVIITCSDSRVIPESIFMAGIGELFVIRTAGNTMGNPQLGSVEYAVSHLGCRLVVVLGHTDCGAVDAAINHNPAGYVKFITDEIRRAVGDEKDSGKACVMNVKRSVEIIGESLGISGNDSEITVIGAVYDIGTGEVRFLE